MLRIGSNFLVIFLFFTLLIPVEGAQRRKHKTSQSKTVTEVSKPPTRTSVIETADEPIPSNPEIMPLSEIRVGMKGFGLSVFKGTKPERFDFEVTGFRNSIKNFETIFVNIYDHRGDTIKTTSVIAGMSGSPMFINDKIIGALAYAGEFTKESWALVTPIKYMLDMVKLLPKTNEENKYLLPETRQRQTGKNKLDEILLGDSYCYFFSWGDVSMAANATITYVDRQDGYIYSQGHPGMQPIALGRTALPFGKANVYKTVAMQGISYKLAEPTGPILGSIILDAHWGQVGKLGIFPKSIPVSVKTEGDLNNVIVSNSHVAYIPQAPQIIQSMLGYLAVKNLDPSKSVAVTVRISLKDKPEIFFSDHFEAAANSLAEIVDLVVNDSSQTLEIENIQATIKPESADNFYELEQVTVLKLTPDGYTPLRIQIKKDGDGSVYERLLPFKLPAHLPPNSPFGHAFTLCDGATLQSRILSSASLRDALPYFDGIRDRQTLYLVYSIPGSETVVAKDNIPGWQKKLVVESFIILLKIDAELKVNGKTEFLIPLPEPAEKTPEKADKKEKKDKPKKEADTGN